MSKRDRDRAIAGDPFCNQVKIKIKCVFPPCTTPVMVDPPPEGVTAGSPQHMAKLGGIPFCPKHAEMLNFYVWCQQSIKLEAQRTPSGLVLPGNEKFEATVKATPGKVR